MHGSPGHNILPKSSRPAPAGRRRLSYSLFRSPTRALNMRTFLLAALAAFLLAPAAFAQSGAFSSSIAIHDGQAVVGAPSHPHASGQVHVFSPEDDGSWTKTATLSAEDGVLEDGFGTSLAVSDNWMIVGAPAAQAAYLFQRGDNGAWTQVQRLAPADSAEGYARTVAIDGSRAVVGVVTASDTGRALVYERGTESWTLTATLAGSDVEKGSQFGSALALSGDHLLIGAPGSNTGTVFSFTYDVEDGSWTETGQVTRDRMRRGAQFGAALELRRTSDGSLHLLAGAPREDSRTGAAYTFTYDADADVWRAGDRLLPFDGESPHAFGSAVAFDGASIWVSAPGAADRAGAIYRYDRSSDGSWSSVQRFTTADGKPNIGLGTTLAATNALLVAGQPGASYRSGTAAVFAPDEDGTWAMRSTLDPGPYEVLSTQTGERVRCTDGKAGRFSCEQLDMSAFLPVHEIGGTRGVRLNDIWGWTDPQTGREYALVGRINGTSFVDVTDPGNPVFVGDLPLHEGSRANVWRDIKVYADHAYVVADNAGPAGMQVFDLNQLRDVTPEEMPVTFSETAHYDRVNSSHNVIVNEETGYAFIVGASGGGETCGGGLHMVDVRTPSEPTFAGCFADPSTGRTGTGYSHDAQCVIYEGPDAEHQGKEICFGANETAISIADVSDKENPEAISTGSYPDHGYVHQGWLDPQQEYFYVNDELDEINGLAENTRTLVWDVSDLDDPQLVKEFFLPERSSDHNLYIVGDTMYQSNYVSGLRMIDIADRENPVEVGHFDTVPFGDNTPGFGGSWSNYPFFESGTIVVTSGNEGLFVLKRAEQNL
jgi:choice-of-anchor B domain-containing protein